MKRQVRLASSQSRGYLEAEAARQARGARESGATIARDARNCARVASQ